MKKNMGSADRVLRFMAAVVIAILYLTHQISGTVAIGLLVIAGILILTSFVSFCPLYLPFKINTAKDDE